MSKNSQILKRVHYLLHRGENIAARRLLSVLLQESPQDESVWMRYVDTFGSRAERKRAFEQWRRAMPNNVHARYGLERDARLRGRTQRPLTAPSRSIRLDNRFGWAIAILSAILILSLSSIWVMAQSNDPPLQPTDSQLRLEYNLALPANQDQLEAEIERLRSANLALENAQYSLRGSYDLLMEQHDKLVVDHDELRQEHETTIYEKNKAEFELEESQNLQSQTATTLQEVQAELAKTQSDLENAREKITNLESIIDLSIRITLQEP